MEQFYHVLKALKGFLNTNKIIVAITPHRIIILFGALAVKLMYTVIIHFITFSWFGSSLYSTLRSGINLIFNQIPLLTVAHFAYLLALWITLASKDIKFVSYALWINVLIGLYPFTSFSLSSLITAVVYAFLGFLVFQFANSSYGKKMIEESE